MKIIIALVVCIQALGLMCLWSAGGENPGVWVVPQTTRFILGLFGVWGLSRIPPRWLREGAYFLYFCTLALLLLILAIGITSMHAKRWIWIPGIGKIQPSEPAKIVCILAFARFFSENHCFERRHFFKFMLLLGAPFLCIALQPDLGTALIVVFIGLLTAWQADVPKKWFGIGALSLVCSAPLAIVFALKPYQKARLAVFLGHGHTNSTGYQVLQSKIALGSGGFFGKGLSSGTQNTLSFLPEKQTDFVFALFGEAFGFAGVCVLLTLYTLLLIFLYFKAFSVSKTFDRLLVLGVANLLFVHATVNIAMTFGALPVVGVPLPWMSYGGSSVLTCMLGLGLVASCLKKR